MAEREEIKDEGRAYLSSMLLDILIMAAKQAMLRFLPAKFAGILLGGPAGFILSIVLPKILGPLADVLIKLGIFWKIDNEAYRKSERYNAAWEKFKPIEAAYNGHLTEEQEKINEELDHAIDDALSWD